MTCDRVLKQWVKDKMFFLCENNEELEDEYFKEIKSYKKEKRYLFFLLEDILDSSLHPTIKNNLKENVERIIEEQE